MSAARPPKDRRLSAEWVVDERDLVLAAKLVPGATLNLLRWPVACAVAYVGVASSAIGLVLAFVSALVVTAFWVVLLLGLRRRIIRRQARLPESQRRVRLSLDRETLRYEDAGGRAHERPLDDVIGAVHCPEGVLLRIRNQVLFIPDRALGSSQDAWHDAFRPVPEWTQPIGAPFTYGLWVFATAVAVYARSK